MTPSGRWLCVAPGAARARAHRGRNRDARSADWREHGDLTVVDPVPLRFAEPQRLTMVRWRDPKRRHANQNTPDEGLFASIFKPTQRFPCLRDRRIADLAKAFESLVRTSERSIGSDARKYR